MKITGKSLPSLAIVCVTSLILMVGVWFLLAKTVDKIILKESETVALHWVSYFDDHLENIEPLINDGVLNQKQSEVINIALDFGEVFLFKVFRPDGTLSINYDENEELQDDESVTEVNQTALDVFNTGISNIATNDGRGEANRPDVYVEAYVPITNNAGTRIAVAEVYVDQTEMMASLKNGFYWIAMFLPVISALFFYSLHWHC